MGVIIDSIQYYNILRGEVTVPVCKMREDEPIGRGAAAAKPCQGENGGVMKSAGHLQCVDLASEYVGTSILLVFCLSVSSVARKHDLICLALKSTYSKNVLKQACAATCRPSTFCTICTVVATEPQSFHFPLPPPSVRKVGEHQSLGRVLQYLSSRLTYWQSIRFPFPARRQPDTTT